MVTTAKQAIISKISEDFGPMTGLAIAAAIEIAEKRVQPEDVQAYGEVAINILTGED
jgi:hypothetical protein